MGHSRIGKLPATRKWKNVVRLIAEGANVPQVASATLKAADRAFAWVQEDASFREAAKLLVEIGLAVREKNPVEALATMGLHLSDNPSAVEVGAAVGDLFDERVEGCRERSDFGEMAGKALVGAAIERLKSDQLSLFASTCEGVVKALKGRGENGFGEFARSFFSRLTEGTLDYFLSKTLGTQLGEGQRFATNNQMAEFMGAMRLHCDEASVIAKEFAGDWFSKRRFEEGGTISSKSIEGFAWYAMQKIRAELDVRAQEQS